MFEMMILKHDPKYNRTKDIINKLREESLELQNALKYNDEAEIVDEALDVITVALNAINEQSKGGMNIETAIEKHQKKLKCRDWKADKIIRFYVEEEKNE